MTRFLGILGLLLAGAAVAIGARLVFEASPLFGFIYLGVLAVGGGAVILAFCAKCPCKRDCAHLLPGLFARLVDRAPGPYSRLEIAVVAVAILAIVVFPQLWLRHDTTQLLVFWGLFAVAGSLSVFGLCRRCDNTFCPANRRR